MIKLLRLTLTLVIANIIYYNGSAQSLGVNTTGAPAATSSILDVSSTDKGILIPRMSKTERNAIVTPATGLMVYQNAPDSMGFYYYDGTIWQLLSTATTAAGWLTTGNAGTTITSHFFGTTDVAPLSFRQNNKWLGRWNSVNNTYFIGDSSGINNVGTSNVGFGTKALFKNLNGYGNVAIGNSVMQNNTMALRNTAVGDSAMFTQSYNPGGGYFTDNTAIGSKALFYNQPTANSNGYKNTAVGSEALYLNTTGYENTAMGTGAMRENTTGFANTAFGRSAHRLSKSGYYNSYFGYIAGYSDSSGLGNTGLGAYSLFNHRKGDDNVAIGISAMGVDTAGVFNTAIGAYANHYSDTTYGTAAVGYATLFYNKRDFNTAVGAYAGYSNSRTSTNNSQGTENTMLGYAALTGNAFGSQNTAVGHKAMSILEPGFYTGGSPSRNVAVGDSALNKNVGSDNVGIGYRALSKVNNTNQNYHVAVGSRALLNTTATYPNTAVGYSSQDSLTTGVANTSVGAYSLTANKTGSNNTAIGNWAMHDAYNPQGFNYPFDNTAVGNDALRSTRYYGHVAVGAGVLRYDTSGIYNTAVGYLSMAENLSGYYNTAMGTNTLRNNTTGYGNTAIGLNSMYNHKSYGYNTAIGHESMFYDTSGAYNTAVGWRSLRYSKSGLENTAIGVGAIEFADSSARNTAVGRGAMIGVVGSKGVTDNIAIGFYAAGASDTIQRTVNIGGSAGYNNEGDENVFVGYGSGYGSSGLNLTGIENTGLGTYTLTYNSSGRSNTAVGMGALYGNRIGSNNTAVGVRSMLNGQSGSNNAALGDSTMIFSTGSNNTAVGHFVLRNNTTGAENVAVGANALLNNNIGTQNTIIGKDAGIAITSGTNNTVIGYAANVASASLINAAAIGSQSLVSQNNSMVLGSINGTNGATATTSVGIGTTAPGARLHLRANGSSGGTFIANPSMIIEDNTQSYVQLSNPTNSENGILSGNALTTIRSGIVFGIDSSLHLRSGGNNTRLFIDDIGFIGMGTTTPTTRLHVYENSSRNVNARIASVNSGFEPGLELVKTGAGGIDWKMRVDAGNFLAFSRATDDFTATPTDYFQMSNATFRPVADNSATLGQATNRWSTVYAFNGVINTSDLREKENVENLNYGLKEIMQLRPVTYSWKENPQWGKKIGFIAQEVKPILEEVVQTGALKSKQEIKEDAAGSAKETDRLGIYYTDIIPVAVKAIQEQQQQIEHITKENESLRAKNVQLEKDIQFIKDKLGIK